MNSFNIVLNVIKKHCKETNVPNADCFERLRSELTDSDQAYLDFYLDFLQDLGLIQYNDSNKYIILTDSGRSVEQIFT